MKSKAELRDKVRRLKRKLKKLEKSKLARKLNTAKADLVDMSEDVDAWMKLSIDHNHEIGQLKTTIGNLGRDRDIAVRASQLDASELRELRAWLVHKNRLTYRQ